jgi:malonyl-CoA O-methyltransferase
MKSFLPVVEAYDRWSRFYDAYENPMVFLAEEIVRRSVLPGARNQAVFEFGCGTGRNLAALRDAGAASVSGCDLSEGMLSVARQRRLLTNVFLHDMREPLPRIADRSMDHVLFCLSLEHVENLGAPFREALRIAKPGGGRISIVEIHPFLSLNGVAAHFDDNGEEVRMPAYPHQFSAFLNLFADHKLNATCREWRPCDVGNPAPLKNLKRGPEFPLAVEFSITL